MDTRKKWTIWPILNFEAGWPETIYEHFDLDIKIIKAGTNDYDGLAMAYLQNY